MAVQLKKRKLKKGCIVSLALFGAALLTALILSVIYIDNQTLDYEYIAVQSPETAPARVKIAHLSDLHFPRIQADVNALAEGLRSEAPDLIAITGDLIDDEADTRQSGVTEFIAKIKDVAPIFYVNGNHETRIPEQSAILYGILKTNGVTVLRNASARLTVNGAGVTVIGADEDADYGADCLTGNSGAASDYRILLTHRPEKWTTSAAAEPAIRPHLTLSGHAHGGQIRVFGQGLFAPDQGFFPQYDAGLYVNADGDSRLIVSRGIGNSAFPFRFNNKPHIPIIIIEN